VRLNGTIVIGRGPRWEREALVHDLTQRLVGMVGDEFGYRATDIQREYAFHDRGRRWRFDIAIVPARVAVEVQGYFAGGHGGPRGFHVDCEKFTEAGAMGWIVLPVTYAMLRRDAVVHQVRRAIATRATRSESGRTPRPDVHGGRLSGAVSRT